MGDSRIRYRVIDDVRDLSISGRVFDSEARGVAIIITGFKSFMDQGQVEERILEILRSAPRDSTHKKGE